MAMWTGFGTTSASFLYDTLLAEYKKCEGKKGKKTDKNECNNETKKSFGMSNEEVLAIVAHEIGHWKLWHNTYDIIIMELSLFAQLAAFAWLYKQPVLYNAFGFYDEYPVAIGHTGTARMIGCILRRLWPCRLSRTQTCSRGVWRLSAPLKQVLMSDFTMDMLGQLARATEDIRAAPGAAVLTGGARCTADRLED
ncbi:hypothetical protein D918_06708 [Trichuris suis]|nr:hypothetical protein D918_06708 [Trichuris suis]